MEISRLSQRNIQILVAVITLIIFSTIIWHYEQSIANHRSAILDYEQSIADHQSSIQSLQEQLLTQKRSNQQLIENLDQAQATWEVTEKILQDLIAMDWESKFADAMDENESLHKQIMKLKYQYEIDNARLQRAQRFLSSENNSMRDSHGKLQGVNHELEQNIAKLQSDIDQQNKTMAKQELLIKQQNKAIASLQKPVEEKLAPEPPLVQPITARTSTGEDDKSDVYRLVRIQSLNNTTRNQDSVARKNILVSVIPTIPNGVSGEEFLSLVAGMKSEDIMTTIQLTNKYIIRPLDSKTLSALTGILNEKDAEAVSLIFKTKE